MTILDRTALESLKDLQVKSGRNFLPELIKLYVDSTPPIIVNMRKHLLSKAYEDLAREAHSLKSSSGNLGARAVEALAKEIEYGIIGEKKLTDEEIHRAIGRIETEFELTTKALLTFI